MHCYQWNPLLLLSNANGLICNQYDFNIGECLAPTNPKTNLILDTLNDSSCMELYRKQEVVPPEMIPLHVNQSCVNNSHVSTAQLSTEGVTIETEKKTTTVTTARRMSHNSLFSMEY